MKKTNLTIVFLTLLSFSLVSAWTLPWNERALMSPVDLGTTIPNSASYTNCADFGFTEDGQQGNPGTHPYGGLTAEKAWGAISWKTDNAVGNTKTVYIIQNGIPKAVTGKDSMEIFYCNNNKREKTTYALSGGVAVSKSLNFDVKELGKKDLPTKSVSSAVVVSAPAFCTTYQGFVWTQNGKGVKTTSCDANGDFVTSSCNGNEIVSQVTDCMAGCDQNNGCKGITCSASTDTDPTQDKGNKGTLVSVDTSTGQTKNLDDTCVSQTVLKQYSCVDGKVTSTNDVCGSCVAGACLGAAVNSQEGRIEALENAVCQLATYHGLTFSFC